eukprot:scaffold104404_cov58-Attheya_sp.AAC.1
MGDEGVSPVDVLDHMIDRAEEEPLAFTFLLDLRLTEILWMFRDSERTGENGCDPELFRVATKYAALLYATTN